MDSDKPPFDGLVLSGGAARGAAFLGALDELGRRAQLGGLRVVAGTSIGALAAVLVAQGADMQTVLTKIASRPFQLGVNFVSMEQGFGIDSGESLLEFTRSLIGRSTFLQLHQATGKTVLVCATSLLDRRPVYFSHQTHPNLEVAFAVRLSCSLPFLFAYGMEDGKAYVDGGLSDNFPVTAAAKHGCRSILGLRFRQPEPRARPEELTEYVLALMACVAWQARPWDSLCARVVELNVEPGTALDFGMSEASLRALFELGRKGVAS